MKKEDYHLNDINRWLIGEAPWLFLIEVAIRTTIVYFVFLIVMRILGKRMAAQLTLFELIIIIVLGAAIALPMQAPDRGMIPGFIILLVMVIFEKGLNYINFKSRKIEILTTGNLSVLVKDGVILVDEMEKCLLSRERLFSELRTQEIKQLGQVERLYLEACGQFTIFQFEQERFGLSIFPDWDKTINAEQQVAERQLVCTKCGNTVSAGIKGKCNNCSSDSWVKAIKSKSN